MFSVVESLRSKWVCHPSSPVPFQTKIPVPLLSTVSRALREKVLCNIHSVSYYLTGLFVCQSYVVYGTSPTWIRFLTSTIVLTLWPESRFYSHSTRSVNGGLVLKFSTVVLFILTLRYKNFLVLITVFLDTTCFIVLKTNENGN